MKSLVLLPSGVWCASVENYPFTSFSGDSVSSTSNFPGNEGETEQDAYEQGGICYTVARSWLLVRRGFDRWTEARLYFIYRIIVIICCYRYSAHCKCIYCIKCANVHYMYDRSTSGLHIIPGPILP